MRTVIGVTSVTYTLGLIGLNQLWYKDFPREGFHFFNDNPEWNQVDKVGHMYAAFHLSDMGYRALKWTGLEEKKAILWGGAFSLLFLTPIEILDGYSSEFGASYGDFIANTSGGLLFIGQMLIWDEIRIQPKYSFNRTHFAEFRPNVLGDGYHEELFKDYNGQTYWLSFDLDKFFPQVKVPKWLNFGFGYGTHNMIYARKFSNVSAGFLPYRQFYWGIDVDLSYLKTKSKFLNALLFVINGIHLPAPVLEYNKENGIKLHYLYF